MRFSAPAIFPVAARFTGLAAAAGTTSTEATLESAVPRGEGEVSRSPLALVSRDRVVAIVLAVTCRGPDETGLTYALTLAVIVDDPLDTGLVEVAVHESDDEGVSNSGGGV